MERIFWVECPECHGHFYCNHREMKSSGVRLMCPFCRARFLPEEAPTLDERTEQTDQPEHVGNPK